jgi:hypothetical protein
VNPGNVGDDNDPAFVSEFYKNLRLLSQDLYKRTASMGIIPGQPTMDLFSSSAATAGAGGELTMKSLEKKGSFGSMFDLAPPSGSGAGAGAGQLQSQATLKKKPSLNLSSVSAAGAGTGTGTITPPTPSGSSVYSTVNTMNNVESTEYFSQENFQERMKMYIREVGIDPEYVSRYTVDMKTRKQQQQQQSSSSSASDQPQPTSARPPLLSQSSFNRMGSNADTFFGPAANTSEAHDT